MQSWDGLRLALAELGFRKILYFELSCGDHGDFRSAYEPDGEFRPACPRCGRPAEASILAEGYTRRTTIPWGLVSSALPANAKGYREPAAPKRKAPDWHKPRSGRPPRRQAEQARLADRNGVTLYPQKIPAAQHSAS
jgi:hypothetical protein